MTVTIFTVNGTAQAGPEDPWQYPVQTVRALLPQPMAAFCAKLDGIKYVRKFSWYAVDYPAATFPMESSVDVGIENLVASILATPGEFVLFGYSQGAVVTSRVWRDEILNPNGRLHHRLKDFRGGITWGNPLRARGIARGNDYAGWPLPTGDAVDHFLSGQDPEITGGIAGEGEVLTADETPWNWLDFANPNDLYTDRPWNRAGHDETLIYNIVMSTGGWDTFQAIVNMMLDAFQQFDNPVEELIGLAEAIYNGLRFAVAGPNSGHYTYDVTPAIRWMQETLG